MRASLPLPDLPATERKFRHSRKTGARAIFVQTLRCGRSVEVAYFYSKCFLCMTCKRSEGYPGSDVRRIEPFSIIPFSAEVGFPGSRGWYQTRGSRYCLSDQLLLGPDQPECAVLREQKATRSSLFPRPRLFSDSSLPCPPATSLPFPLSTPERPVQTRSNLDRPTPTWNRSPLASSTGDHRCERSAR